MLKSGSQLSGKEHKEGTVGKPACCGSYTPEPQDIPQLSILTLAARKHTLLLAQKAQVYLFSTATLKAND